MLDGACGWSIVAGVETESLRGTGVEGIQLGVGGWFGRG